MNALIQTLAECGISVRLIEGQLKVYPPSTWTSWHDAPAEARPLLRELRSRRDEMVAFLNKWDQAEAYNLLGQAASRASKTFSREAWDLARDRRPELLNRIWDTEQAFNRSYRAQDMPACRAAVQRYEQGFAELATYGQTGGPPDT